MATIIGLELKAVHVNAWVDWVFVQVQTDHGVQGLGELSVRLRVHAVLPLGSTAAAAACRACSNSC